MCTTLNLITNEIVYTLSNLRSRRFFREGRVIFESRKSARHPEGGKPATRKTREKARRKTVCRVSIYFWIYQATGELENLIDL